MTRAGTCVGPHVPGIGILLGASLAVFGGGLAAQQPTFRAGIDIVHIDVDVLDKDHHPVRGLTASNFKFT